MSVGIYIGRRALAMIAAVFGVLLVIYVCVDMVELLATFAGQLDAFNAMAHKLPLIAAQMLPVSVTLGLSSTLSSMRLRGEWDGLRAVGISPWRLGTQLLLVAVVLSLLSGFLVMYAAPSGLRAMDAITGSTTRPAAKVSWRVTDKMAVGSLDDGSIVTADRTGDEGLVWCRYRSAPDPCLCWSLQTGWGSTCLGGHDREAIFEARGATPVRAEFDPFRADASRRGPLELWREAQHLESLGVGGAAFRAELSLRLATVAACLAVPALVIALLVTSRMQRPTTVLLLALGAAFVYYGVLVVTWNLVVTETASFYLGAFGAPGFYVGCAVAVAVVRRRKVG